MYVITFTYFIFISLFQTQPNVSANFVQSQPKLADSLLNKAKKDTTYINLKRLNSYHFSKEKIDSINSINVQGINISQDSVKRLFEANILSAKAIGYLKGEAEAYLKLGVNYFYLGNYKANFESQLEAIKIYEHIEENALAAKAYGELGYVTRRRDLNLANELMQKAIKLAKTDSLSAKIQDIYNNYSILKLMERKFDSAKYYAKRGLHIKEKLKDSLGIPYSYANLGNILADEGKLDEARFNYNKALILRKEIKDSIGLGESYVQLAEIYSQQNKHDKALANYKNSMYFASKKEYEQLLSYTCFKLSDTYKKINKTDSALHYLEKHLKLKDSIESKEVLKELALLRVQYDTERKEKELLITKTEKANTELKLSNQRLLTYGLIGGLVLICFLAYGLFQRNRRKHQEILANQKEQNLQSIILAEENERSKIARDLHDGIVQQIGATILKSRHTFEKLGLAENSDSQEIINDLELSTNELRTISHQMMPRVLEEKGLVEALNDLFNSSLNTSEIAFQFEHFNLTQISKTVEKTLYRITQELVNNVLKHSNASEVQVQLYQTKSHIIYMFEDNGKGLKTRKKEGIGLKNIQSRVDLIKGIINFSTENSGTLTTIKIPVHND